MNTNDNKAALAPQVISTDTTTLGEIVDLQNASKHKVAVQFGPVTDGDYQIVIEHGNDSGLSDAADVDATDQVRGNRYNEAIANAADKDVFEFELLRKFKRFARVKVISANTTVGALIAAQWVEWDLSNSKPNDKNKVA